jgi:hypothetical protein
LTNYATARRVLMSRRLSKSIVAILAISVILGSTPSAYAGGRRGPDFGSEESIDTPVVERVVRILKKLVKPLLPPQTHDDGVFQPSPPKP